MMKTTMQGRLLRTAVLLCGAGLMASVALAQDPGAPAPMPEKQQVPPGGQRGPGGRGGDPERMIDGMQKELNLTPDQTTQVRAIFADQRTKLMALRSDTSTPREQKRGQMMGIMKDSDSRIDAILTPEQKPKYAAMRERMRERMQERRGQGGPGGDMSAPPPPPPPPPPPVQ